MFTACRERDIRPGSQMFAACSQRDTKDELEHSPSPFRWGRFFWEALMQAGDVVHIKDSFFELMQDNALMSNKENGGYRPHFLCIQDPVHPEIFWAVPLSSRVQKYREIAAKKEARYGRCDTIVIAPFCGRDCAYLIQNAFPITEIFIDHHHTVGGVPVHIGKSLRQEIERKLRRVLAVNRNRKGLLFPDVEAILEKLV